MAATKETPMSESATMSSKMTPELVEIVTAFMKRNGAFHAIKPEHNLQDSFSNLIGGLLKVNSIQQGKLYCLLSVKAPILNVYGGMHGGAVASVAERVAAACARTVMGKNKDIFLGDLNISYLSSAPLKAELVIDGCVIRSGRNFTVVAVDFRHKESGRLAYMARATFYNMPASCL